MLTEDRIKDLQQRLESISQETDIITFPEIKLTGQQLEIISEPLLGFTKDELYEYYRGKIHGEILQSSSAYTTREDQPDFQYLVDLGVKALKSGMTL